MNWTSTEMLCNVWIYLIQVGVGATILHLLAISLDRYWTVTKPLEYIAKRTSNRMIAYIAMIWLGAACTALPTLFIENTYNDQNDRPICIASGYIAYQIYRAIATFYIPYSIMMCVFFKMYRKARRITSVERRTIFHLDGGVKFISSSNQKHSCFKLPKQYKASTKILILMIVFTICWLPYAAFVIIRIFFDTTTRYFLKLPFFWIGYLNTFLNPCLIAMMFQDFRQSMQEVVCFRCTKMNRMMREKFYQKSYGEGTFHHHDSNEFFSECL